MDLSTDPRVQIDCERCGRRIGLWEAMEAADQPDGISIYEVEREPLRDRYVRPTGRHRLHYVEDGHTGSVGFHMNGEPAYGTAYAVECGCGHQRTIGRGALKRKLLSAAEPRIRL